MNRVSYALAAALLAGTLASPAQAATLLSYNFSFDVDGPMNTGNPYSGSYEFNFDKEKDYNGHLGVTKILLANGYKKSRKLWEANSRVKKIRMYVNGAPYRDLMLLDNFEIQTIDIGKIMFPPHKTTILKFEILEVYPGKKYKETAISELVFEGVGVH